jgi:hypothetical protein
MCRSLHSNRNLVSSDGSFKGRTRGLSGDVPGQLTRGAARRQVGRGSYSFLEERSEYSSSLKELLRARKQANSQRNCSTRAAVQLSQEEVWPRMMQWMSSADISKMR